MRRPSDIDAPSTTRWPRKVLAIAGLFALICFGLQAWRLFSLSATYDQALFLQELWATAQGRPFESSLSSVLSCLLYTSPSPRDPKTSRMPSSA